MQVFDDSDKVGADVLLQWLPTKLHANPVEGRLEVNEDVLEVSLVWRYFSQRMLQVILKRFKARAEELLAEEQAGFRPGRSTVEQIFNSQVITEKHLQPSA